MLLVLLLLFAFCHAAAQDLLVYPELQRPAIRGDILAADRNAREWEIISPATPRNGYLSFFVVVKLREPGFFRLDVVMNPADRLRADLYRVHYAKVNGSSEYYPEALTPAGRTVIGTLPDPDVPALRVAQQEGAGQGQAHLPAGGHERNSRQDQYAAVAAYWLDLYVPSETPAERVRVEAVLQSAGPRIVYPMEIRVLPIAFPAWNAASLLRGPAVTLAPISEPAQATMVRELDGWLKGEPLRPPSAGAETIRQKIARNTLQDLALLDSLEPTLGREALREEVRKLRSAPPPRLDWWLDFRRWLYHQAREP